jgi:hypothetical protein
MVDQGVIGRTFKFNDLRKESWSYYISSIIWPFAMMLISIRDWKRPWSKNVFWYFCIFFGFAFIFGREGEADSDYYAKLLIHYSYSNLNLTELWRTLYSESSGNLDIASPLIIFLVSRTTNNPSLLFAVFGFIFGYFYSRNIWFVLGQVKGNFTIFVILIVLTFALVNPIWNINGFRMWTAAQIFLFGTLPYLMESNIKKLFWSGASVLFHFSFMFPLIILILFIFLKNRLNLYMVFFILTSLIKEIDLQSVQSALSFLPDIFQPRVSGYTNFEYANSVITREQLLNWYVGFSSDSLKWVTYIMVFFIYFFCNELLKSRHSLMTLFCYSLFLYGFANISSQVPSGARFITVASTFMVPCFAIFNSSLSKIRGLIFVKSLSIPLLLLFLIVTIRIGMDFFGFLAIFGNPFLAAFYSDTVPFIAGIKGLF